MRDGPLRSALMAIAGLAAATALVEIGFAVAMATPLRWVLPVPPMSVYGPDPTTGYRHRTSISGMLTNEHRSSLTTSNLGLRDRDRSAAHGSGPRALILGNSYVEATQVELPETATAVAENILARQRPGAEVINLGLASASPAVMVARLQSQGLALRPDATVVMVQYDDFVAHDDSDREFPSYRRGNDGELRLSFGFRDTPEYRFRISSAGRAVYWLMDHSQIARLINARKNVGLLAEWPRPASTAAPDAPDDPCASRWLDAPTALWIEGKPQEARAVFGAFLRDLAVIAHARPMPVVLATRGIEARCAALADKRAMLIEAIRGQVETAGLHYADFDARVAAKVGADNVPRLHGFGAGLGVGHLNVEGNRIYGEIFADIIAGLLPR